MACPNLAVNRGNWTHPTHPLSSSVTSFGYDAASNLVSKTDPRGYVTTRTLDNLYRTASIVQPDPDGAGPLSSPVTSFTYDAASQMLTTTDPMNRLTSFEYDGLGRQTKWIQPDPDGTGPATRPTTTRAYDAVANVVSITDPLNQTTSYTYDNLYRLTRETDPNNGQTNYTYDAVGNRLTLKDPVNNTTTWVYDNLDRVISDTNALGRARTFVYDAVGNLTQKTDRNGRVIQYVYDGLDRNTQEKWTSQGPAPSVSVSTTTEGAITSEVQTVGYTSMVIQGGTFKLTFNGQTTGDIAYNASAATVQTALSGLSNIGSGNISVTKLTNSSTSQTWQLTFQGTLAQTNVSQVTIDTIAINAVPPINKVETTSTQGGTQINEVQSVTVNNASGGTFTLSFGGQTTTPLAYNATAAQVDAALDALSTIDNVSVTGNAGGPYTITFGGTQSGQNVSQLTADSSGLTNIIVNRTLSFTFDAASQLTAASDPAASYSYVYDMLGRKTQETQTITGLVAQIVFNQKFDATSNRTELTAKIGTTDDFKNTYTFDGLNRMTQVIQQAQAGGGAVLPKRVDFTYNAASQFDTIARYNDTAGTQQVIATSHLYDGIGRLTTLDHKKSGTSLARYDYTFDPDSRITSVNSLVDGVTNFSYDVTDQLTGADHASQPDENYSFDLNGNRTMAGYAVQTNNRLTSDGTYNYEYDHEGNRTARVKISTGERTEYEWDYRNRLTKVTEKNSSGQVTRTTEQSYDVFNRWVRRRVDLDGPGPGAATDMLFIHDEEQIVLQFNGGQGSNLDHRYLWGAAVDQLLADQDANSLMSAGTNLWPLGDHLGTLRDLASYNSSNNTTTVSNHRRYDSFGNLVSETNAVVDELFGFTGRALDEFTGLQNNWNRWYDSRVGRWISEDPIRFAAGDANLSRYVGNSSTFTTDPSGFADWVWPWDPRANRNLGDNYDFWKDKAIDAIAEAGSPGDALDRMYRRDYRQNVSNGSAPFATFSPEDMGLLADLGQLALDVVGIFEPTPFCDLTSAGISLIRGDFLGAGISVLSVLPAGDLAKILKLEKYVDSALTIIQKGGALLDEAKPLLRKIFDALDNVDLDSIPLPEGLKRKLLQLRDELRETFNDAPKKKGSKAVDEKCDSPPGGGETSEAARGKQAADEHGVADGSVRFKKWKRGEPIDKPMPDGSPPDWKTVQSRYWKNRYEAAKDSGEFTQAQLKEMRKGNAPLDYNPRTGKWERRELHHVDPQRHTVDNSPLNLRELTPDWHAEVDPFRHVPGITPDRGIR